MSAVTGGTDDDLFRRDRLQFHIFNRRMKSSCRVALVNERLASRYWKGQNPLGQRLRPGGGDTVAIPGTSLVVENPWFTVIGVAKDVKQRSIDEKVRPEVYLLVVQVARHSLGMWVGLSPTTMHAVTRTTVPRATVASSIAQVVRRVDPTLPVAHLREMDEVFEQSMERPRQLAPLLTLFSAVALMLAAIGTYGLLAFALAERRREIGIHLAVCATRTSILSHVLSNGSKLTSVGAVTGFVGHARTEPANHLAAIRRAGNRCAHSSCRDRNHLARGRASMRAAGMAGDNGRSDASACGRNR